MQRIWKKSTDKDKEINLEKMAGNGKERHCNERTRQGRAGYSKAAQGWKAR